MAAQRKAGVALQLSLLGLCCSPVSLGGLVVGILAIVESSGCKDRNGVGVAIAAVVISAVPLLVFLTLVLVSAAGAR